jgi:alpha-L-fucosidase
MKQNPSNKKSLVLLMARWVVGIMLTIALFPTAQAGTSSTDWFKNAKYGIFVHYFPGANANITGQAADGSWDVANWNFNAPEFARQVDLAGAKYVVFTIGQSNGYLCTPSSTYEYYCGMSRGGFSPGRDLIKDIANALYPYGIQLIAYYTGSGPYAATPYPNPNGNGYINPGTALYTGANTTSAGNAMDANFRAINNAMLQEWSQRWGSSVSGWWIDGCWVAGYSGSNVSNLNTLIASCKSGNPNAIVAVNPGVDFTGKEYEALTVAQDYICGEDVKFRRYPSSRYRTYGTNNIQWSTTAYLGQDVNGQAGTGWARPAASQYINDQLIHYVKHVNDREGVVTIDVAVDGSGNIYSSHLTQMQALKTAIRSGGGVTAFADLARYKPVKMMSNGSSGELATNAYDLYSINALDPNATKQAQPTNEWAWNLQVDLRAATNVKRSNVRFDANNYTTAFDIQYSNNGTTWTTWATATSAQVTAARSTSGTSLVGNGTGQYWRLRSTSTSTTQQMGVKSFQLYAN